DDEVFENLVEDRLSAGAGKAARRYEILNFAQPADSTFQYLVELERRAALFDPDAVFVFVNATECKRTLTHLGSVYRANSAVPYDRIRQVFDEAGLEAGMSAELITAKLKPFTAKLMVFAFQQLADFGRRKNVPVYLLFRPSVISWSRRNADEEVR